MNTQHSPAGGSAVHRLLDELFAGLPATPDALDLKEEIRANLVARASELEEQGRTPEQAARTAVDELGDVHELLSDAPPVRTGAANAACGAASATKVMGPAAATATAVSPTPTNNSDSRTRSTRTPNARAASSPISNRRICRPSRNAAGSKIASATEIGCTCSQPRPFRLPVSHTCADVASVMFARVSRYELTEASMALTPMPIRISR